MPKLVNNPYKSYRRNITKEERIKMRKEFNKWKVSDLGRKFVHHQLKIQRKQCYYCDTKIHKNRKDRPYHIDHKIPIYYGGTNKTHNLCLACPECNVVKGTAQLVRDKAYLRGKKYNKNKIFL